MKIQYTQHAINRMAERGATASEIDDVINFGERFVAKYNRIGFRMNFEYNSIWNRKHYSSKQIEVMAVQEGRL